MSLTSQFLECVNFFKEGLLIWDSIMSDALFGGEVVGEVGSRLFDHHHRTGRPAKVS